MQACIRSKPTCRPAHHWKVGVRAQRRAWPYPKISPYLVGALLTDPTPPLVPQNHSTPRAPMDEQSSACCLWPPRLSNLHVQLQPRRLTY